MKLSAKTATKLGRPVTHLTIVSLNEYTRTLIVMKMTTPSEFSSLPNDIRDARCTTDAVISARPIRRIAFQGDAYLNLDRERPKCYRALMKGQLKVKGLVIDATKML